MNIKIFSQKRSCKTSIGRKNSAVPWRFASFVTYKLLCINQKTERQVKIWKTKKKEKFLSKLQLHLQ